MDYNILNFVIFCMGSVADALKMSAKDIYRRMSQGGIISDYIVPCYDVLHTFSRKHLDFGVGFYLSPLEEQARSYGQRFFVPFFLYSFCTAKYPQ